MTDQHRSSRLFLTIATTVVLVASVACGRANQTPSPTPSQALQPVATAAFNLPVGSGVILFQDDFQDGQSDGWQANGGWFVEQSGDRYYFATSGRGWAWVSGGQAWSNYLLHAGLRLESGAAFLSMNVTSAGRYVLRIDEDAVYLIKEQPAGSVATLAQAGALAPGAGHSLVMASQLGHLQVYVDNVLWLDYVDPAPIPAGTIGVSALDGTRVIVDNILVAQFAGSLPSGVAQAPPVADQDPPTPEEIEQDLAQAPIDELPVEPEPEPEVTPPGALPDLMPVGVSWSPDPVVSGQPFQVFFEVVNAGEASAGAFTVRLHYHAQTGVPDCNADFPSLAPGERGGAFCTSVTNAAPGTSPTEFTVDVEGDVTESDEGNNLMTPSLSVSGAANDGDDGQAEDGGGEPQAALPDLVITTIAFNPDPAIQGQPFAALLTVSNRGDADAGIFTVRLSFNPNTGLPDCNWDVDGLGNGGSIRLDCTRTTNAPPGGYRTDLALDVESEIAETNEDNNASNQPLHVAAP